MNKKIPCGGFYLSDTLGVDENGKLGVNGGEPYKQLVTDGSGNAKWEDRLAYFEMDNAEILPEQTVYFEKRNGLYQSKRIDNTLLSSLTVGTKVEVIFDGIKYNCVVFEEEDLYFGNAGIFGRPDTGEPFVFLVNNKHFYTLQKGDSHIISVVAEIRKYHAMDSEYIRQFCANDFFVAGLPTPKQILNDEGINIDIGVTNLKTLMTKNAVFDRIFVRGLSDSISFLRMDHYGTLIKKADGTCNVLYSGIDVVKKCFCDLYFYFDGQADDSVLTNVVIDYAKSVRLQSSTANSTKTFEITVDDTGTISATEI